MKTQMIDNMNLGRAAIMYAEKYHFAVFPLLPKDKSPATKNGFKDATTDRKQIEKWWKQNPNYNIGIATGNMSGGLIVIDMDKDENTGKDGYEVMNRWQQEHGNLPETWMSITGRGGYHWLYREPNTTMKSPRGLYEGVDIRANDGYIVAPPSMHPNGNKYQWETGGGDETPLAAVNDIVREFLKGEPKPEKSQGFHVSETIPQGERTEKLFKLVSSLQSKGLSDDAIMAAVRAENENKCVPPLTDKELEKEVFPALTRYEKGATTYRAVCDNGKARPLKPKEVVRFDLISAKELQGLDIPPLEYIVEKFLPIGLTIIGAPPKSFKSYMCLDMCLCICQGRDFMGFKTKKHACLYLDLESTRRRPKQRVNQILGGKTAPENLFLSTQSAVLGNGFSESLRETLKENPDIKVVVVDVFKKIRPPKKASADPYERDYEDYGTIKQLADELNIAIILVTHTTKMRHPEDPFNELTGSVGTMGSVDVAIVIKKDSRDDENAKLYITGRDLEEQCYEIRFDKKSFRWERLGTHEDMEALRLKENYNNSPVIATIKKMVELNGGKWGGEVAEMIKASHYYEKNCYIYENAREVGKEIRQFQKQLYEWDDIRFSEKRGDHGTKRLIEFEKMDSNPF